MAYTQTDLDTIQAAIKEGARKVKFEGKEVEYLSLAEMEQIERKIQTALNPGPSTAHSPRSLQADFSDC